MPRKDKFHDAAKIALEKEGWEIVYDPLFIPTEGGYNFFIDLGLRNIIGVQRANEKIAVEIKTMQEPSEMYSFYGALGQFLVYELALKERGGSWELYMALPEKEFEKLSAAPIIRKVIKKFALKIIVFEPETQIITSWIK